MSCQQYRLEAWPSARERVVIIGAGIGGLGAAVDLCGRGMDVTVVERADPPGGKIHDALVDGAAIDPGSTVATMRRAFDDLFAGAAEARRFLAFRDRGTRQYRTLETPFMKARKPGLVELTLAIGLHHPPTSGAACPTARCGANPGDGFHDPRQLFGRYATYRGASPFRAPATMMLIAHVDQQCVWLVEGGLQRIPAALATPAERLGADLRCGDAFAEILTSSGRVSGVRLGADSLTSPSRKPPYPA